MKHGTQVPGVHVNAQILQKTNLLSKQIRREVHLLSKTKKHTAYWYFRYMEDQNKKINKTYAGTEEHIKRISEHSLIECLCSRLRQQQIYGHAVISTTTTPFVHLPFAQLWDTHTGKHSNGHDGSVESASTTGPNWPFIFMN